VTWAKRLTKVLTRGRLGHHNKPFRTSKAEIDEISAVPDDGVLFTASPDDGVFFTASLPAASDCFRGLPSPQVTDINSQAWARQNIANHLFSVRDSGSRTGHAPLGARSNFGASSWLSRCPLWLILDIKCGAWYENSATCQLKQHKISAPTHTNVARGNLPLLKDSSLDHRMELDPASSFLSCSCLDLAPPGGLNPMNRRLVCSSVRPHVLQQLSLAWPEQPLQRQRNASSGRKRKGSPA